MQRRVRRTAHAVEVRSSTRDANSNGTDVPYLEDLGERFDDEDHRYEDGETFLGEASDVADQGTEIECDDQQQSNHCPHSDPEPERHEVEFVFSAQFVMFIVCCDIQ